MPQEPMFRTKWITPAQPTPPQLIPILTHAERQALDSAIDIANGLTPHFAQTTAIRQTQKAAGLYTLYLNDICVGMAWTTKQANHVSTRHSPVSVVLFTGRKGRNIHTVATLKQACLLCDVECSKLNT